MESPRETNLIVAFVTTFLTGFSLFFVESPIGVDCTHSIHEPKIQEGSEKTMQKRKALQIRKAQDR